MSNTKLSALHTIHLTHATKMCYLGTVVMPFIDAAGGAQERLR